MCSFSTNTEVINTDYIMNEKLVTTRWEDLPWSLASGGSLPMSAWVICKWDSTKRYAYPPSFFFFFCLMQMAGNPLVQASVWK